MTREQQRGDHAAHYQRYREYYKRKALRAFHCLSPEGKLALSRGRYAKHGEKIRASKRAWAEATLERRRPAMKVYSKKHYQKNRTKRLEQTWAARLKRDFGMTVADYQEMLGQQGGGCAICTKKPTGYRLHVDHDHETGDVRGLLCRECNGGIGMFKDSGDLLGRALAYLESAKGALKEN